MFCLIATEEAMSDDPVSTRCRMSYLSLTFGKIIMCTSHCCFRFGWYWEVTGLLDNVNYDFVNFAWTNPTNDIRLSIAWHFIEKQKTTVNCRFAVKAQYVLKSPQSRTTTYSYS